MIACLEMIGSGANNNSVFYRSLSVAFALFISGLLPAYTHACECLWEGSFTEVAADADLVVLGTASDPMGNALDISVDVTLSGPDWVETPRIWLKTGKYCRPEVSEFEAGERYILALKKITEIPED